MQTNDKHGVGSVKFRALLFTQFLGALNDNLFKIAVSLFAANLAISSGGGSTYLAIGGAVFVLPYLLFSGYAGYLADAYSKRTILIIIKCCEAAVMSLGLLALWSGRIDAMFVVLFLMATQSAFFSPAKYGILPEMLPDGDLSRGNGLLEMTTFVAIICGTIASSFMFDSLTDQLEWIGAVAIVIAICGAITSLGIAKVRTPTDRGPFPLLPWPEIGRGVVRLLGDKPLGLTVLGIAYFWFLGALLQLDVILLGKEVLALDDTYVGLLHVALGVGIGAGSLAAGLLSGHKVELGLVPIGSIGMGTGAVLVAFAAPSFPMTLAALSMIGFFGGFFIVPLDASLQQQTHVEERGRLLATNNVVSMVGVLLASATLWMLRDNFQVQADEIILSVGLATFIVTAYILITLPQYLVRLVLYILVHSLYRIIAVGTEHLPIRGPALLISNHPSLIDGLLVAAATQRRVRFIVNRHFYEKRALNWLLRRMHAIPITSGRPRDVAAAIETARAELRGGHVVCIFAEGAVSRTGATLPFRSGFERIIEGLQVPIVPVHLDQVWGSIFSFKSGRFFWKWPERLPYPITVSFGLPLPANTQAWQVRQAVLELGSEAIKLRRAPAAHLHLRFLRMAKRRWWRTCLADSTGVDMKFGQSLIGSLLLARWFRRERPNDKIVGALLPASAAGALVNIGLLFAQKVPVNLNFTVGPEAVAAAIEQCDITTVVTSRAFMAKTKLTQSDEMIFIEDILASISPVERAFIAAAAYLTPTRVIGWWCGTRNADPSALATIMFTSGSAGVPKGVMLSHENLTTNVEAVAEILSPSSDDKVIGVLPLFHSFGLTCTLWFPLLNGIGAVYHPNPLDAKTIGRLIAKHRATILISTPTFCRAYIKSCTAEQFSTLRYAVVGGEKLSGVIAHDFKEKFGLDLLEGYGCTEMGPVIAVNVADVSFAGVNQTGTKPGTVGQPLPGVAAKIVDVESGEQLGQDDEGLLLVKGASQMLGYLDGTEKTGEVFRDGWYVTGDIASIDEEGFVRITDRLARFSKIGGEMVPHLKIEEAICEIAGVEACVVSSIPDTQKGERLVVLYSSDRDLSAESIWNSLSNGRLPPLWVPRRNNIRRLENIPILASGKVNLVEAKKIINDMSYEN